MTTQIKIDYKEYPECMFAIIAAFLPAEQGHDIRKAAGKVFFRSEDKHGRTYRNGLLHSFDDKPVVNIENIQVWYKDGNIHREGDLPAVIMLNKRQWFKNGVLHRQGKPAYIDGKIEEFYMDGILYIQ